MNNQDSLNLDDYLSILSAQKGCDSVKEKFFELYVLYALNNDLDFSVQMDELFSKTINHLKNYLKIEDFCFMLLDEDCKELKMWKASSEIYKHAKDVTFKAGEGISGLVFQSGEAMLVNNAREEKRFLYYKGKMPDIGSFLSVPLKLSDGRIIGVLNIQKKETNAFKEKDKVLFCSIARNIAHTIERTRRYEKAQKESMFDGLTAVYTRRYFLESSHHEHSKAVRQGSNYSIIVADIDYFKYFNDTYGHAIGDEVLKKLAFLLKSNVREGDIVCRYGGEEFAILLPGIDKEIATTIAEKLRTVIENGLVIEILERKAVTITAGVASYPEDGKTVEEIIAAADKFLYAGKEKGRNRVVNASGENPIELKDEKRVHSRHRTALKIARDAHHVQSIEIRITDKDWKICTVKDVSKNGFKAEIELETEIAGDYAQKNYLCKVVMDSDAGLSETFSIRIVHAARVSPNHYSRYLLGVEVLDKLDTWNKLFVLLKH